MENEQFLKLVKMIASDNDSDAVMGLRSLQGLFNDEQIDFSEALKYLLNNMSDVKAKCAKKADAASEQKGPKPVTVSGMPQTRVPRAGCVEIIPPGKTDGGIIQMQGVAAEQAETIAYNLKDALVLAVINKSRFKLKVVDIKNNRGEVTETILQAEYDREGMSPVKVWSNLRGEVAALATVLRAGMKTAFPDVAA